MISLMRRIRIVRTLALGVALFAVTTSASAGVANKDFSVAMTGDQINGTSSNRFVFSSTGFTAVGDIGFYETDGGFTEFDIFGIFGFWFGDVTRNSVAGGPQVLEVQGIHLFGIVVFGGGSLDGTSVSFSGGVGNSTLALGSAPPWNSPSKPLEDPCMDSFALETPRSLRPAIVQAR